MTLRLRMVLGVVVLVTAGLGLFGVATYTLYARSQYQRLDDQARNAAPLLGRRLAESAGLVGADGGSGGGGDGGGGDGGAGDHGASSTGTRTPTSTPATNGDRQGGPGGPIGAYGELRDPSGATLSTLLLSTSTATPVLPAKLTLPAGAQSRLLTTGSSSAGGKWRVLLTTAHDAPGDTVVVAVPMTEVSDALGHLVLLETTGGAALLALVCAGAWLILRRGLRPLEHMSATAGVIAGGDLTPRVSPAGDNSEVGQLGLALNTMLDRIEAAFAEREATEQRLRQFLADASHELRTPLTSIQGFAELFRLDPDKVDLTTILRRIEEESARMRTLVEDLLLLARVDETRPIEREAVDLAVLAADACSDAVAAAPDRPVTLDAPAPVVVLGDQIHLRQAIANLVTNAVRHTPPGTPIEVGADVRDGSAVVTVRDHGPGLDADAVHHVFDRFWQADAARAGTGAGLGLAIVDAIAKEHHGHAIAGNADDGGAVFTLRLPLETVTS